MKKYTRHGALRLGALSLGGLYLAACGGGGGGGAGPSVDALYDWTYLGAAGDIGAFWRGAQRNLRRSSEDVRFGQLQEVPFESLFQTLDAQEKAKSGADIVTLYGDFYTYREKEL